MSIYACRHAFPQNNQIIYACAYACILVLVICYCWIFCVIVKLDMMVAVSGCVFFKLICSRASDHQCQ